MVILAEDEAIKDKLKQFDISVQTIAEVAPIEVQPARVLSHLYAYLGAEWDPHFVATVEFKLLV